MADYMEQYHRRVNATRNGLVNFQAKLETQKQKLEAEQDPRKQEILRGSIARTQNSINFYETQLKIMRPPTEEDVAYRLNINENFSRAVRAELANDCPLCFHGTRFGNIENILKSGGLSSSVDRVGYSTSYDVEDQVSVTVVNTLETTINGYTGLTSFEEPSGCVFMVLPKDESEYKSSKTSMIIGNVDFRKEPDRLVGILTTPENVEQIQAWCKEYGIECKPDNICTFDNFLERVREKNNTEDSEKQ